MIDMHSHIIPDFDDGSKSFEESIEIIRNYLAEGVSGAVCSSHINEITEQNVIDLESAFEKFKKQINTEFSQFTLYFGAEVSINSGILEKVDLLKRLTVNKTGKYIFIELPLLDIPHFFKEEIYNLCIKGITPIIVHPERNMRIIKNPALLEELIEIGALTQANTGSLLGQYGAKVKKTVAALLKMGLIYLWGSDVHNTSNRALIWNSALKIIKSKVSNETFNNSIFLYPQNIIQGIPIIF